MVTNMSTALTGSPTPRRPSSGRGQSQDSVCGSEAASSIRPESANLLKRSATVLSTSKLANQAPKNLKIVYDQKSVIESHPVDRLLATLSEQQAVLKKQQEALVSNSSFNDDPGQYNISHEYMGSSMSSSLPITPATETFDSAGSSTSPPSSGHGGSQHSGNDEVARLRRELEQAKDQIAQMHQRSTTRYAYDATLTGPSNIDYPLTSSVDYPSSRTSLSQQSGAFSMRHSLGRDKQMSIADDARSDSSDMSNPSFDRTRAIWNGSNRGVSDLQLNTANYAGGAWTSRNFNQGYADSGLMLPNGPINSYGADRTIDPDILMSQVPGRRSAQGSRTTSRNGSFQYPGNPSSYEVINGPAIVGPAPGYIQVPALPTGFIPGAQRYHPQPIGTQLTAHAPEFTPTICPWKTESMSGEGQTYLAPTEPLNYRRLLDRSVNCNWKYIVDKIVCNNDQQASIFLQQKLKVGTTEQKYEIVESIVAQAYPLMVNRFGNFLVQRCFEHGTPEQVIKIAEAIRGNTLNLSMDAFGCHVIQKAFDSVPEEYKAMMVHELLRRIPETVIHRYACHVWQKLFELRWTESPPQIMHHVNEALCGMWHEVALGETGSLVVQNIFENCLEEDKRPCIEEVLASIDIVAHGQFGNWCIQHICEHGAPADRSRAIDHVLRYATEYSMDQFASKVVEKCLKIGGTEFLSRYLDRVCEGRMDRPRIPLIDIASDQYGNYLIQYILTHSNPQHREIVAGHIRKHMVSLRGSKFGSRVGMLCTNPAVATRPGPGAGVSVGSLSTRMPQGSRYGGYR